MSYDFPCTNCGECCRTIPAQLGWPLDEQGYCEMYDHDSKGCKIYATRPPVCDVRGVFDRRVHPLMTWNEWKAFNASICNTMIMENPDLSSFYLIPLTKLGRLASPSS